MAGRLHSRQGLQSGRRAAGRSPSLLLDNFEFFGFFLLFFPLGVGKRWWDGGDVQTPRPHYRHNYIVTTVRP